MTDIRIAEHTDKAHWDEFVLKHESSGPYHLFAWKEAVEVAYHHKPYYLIAEDRKGSIQGVLPLFLVKAPFLKGVLVSLPFCDYGGALTFKPDMKKTLVGYAHGLADSLKVGLDIRCKGQDHDVTSAGSLRASTHKSRMVLALPGSSERLWDQFKSKLRSQIRRPIKEGLEARLGTDAFIDDFYHVIRRNMRDLGSPVHSHAWFASIVEAFGDKVRICVVYKDGSPIGSGMILCSRETVTIPWASTISKYNKLSPNMLLYWELLKFASDNGYRFFDFGRSTPGEGTYRFKEQWGAEPFPLYWYGANVARGDMDASPGRLRLYTEKLWARIPQALTDTVGPLVRRFITL